MRKLLLWLLILILPIAVGATTVEYLPPSGGGVSSLDDIEDLGCSDANPLLHWDDTGSEWLCQPDAGAAGGDSITLNDAVFSASDADFDDDSPVAPAGGVNVLWQGTGSGPSDISAYVPLSSVQGVGLAVTGSQLDVDMTELGDETWGDGLTEATISLIFDPTGTGNPQFDISDGAINLVNSTFSVGGSAVSTGAHFTAADALDAVAAECGDAEALLGDTGHTCLDPASQTEFNSHAARHANGGGDAVDHDTLTNFAANEHYEQRQSADCPTAAGGVQDEVCFDTGDGYFYYCAAASCDGSGWTQQTDGGGAETNTLSSVTTGIDDMQMVLGASTNVAAYLTVTPCAADEKPEFTDASPNTFSCEAIGGLGSADISGLQDEDLGGGGDNDFGDFTCTAAEDGCTLDAGSVSGGSGGDITDGSVTTDDTEAALETRQACVYIEDPVTDEEFLSVWRAPIAVTVTEIWCETDAGTVALDLEIDDGSPLGINGSDISCAVSTGTSDTSFLNSAALAQNNTLDIDLGTVATATRLSVCWRHTVD